MPKKIPRSLLARFNLTFGFCTLAGVMQYWHCSILRFWRRAFVVDFDSDLDEVRYSSVSA